MRRSPSQSLNCSSRELVALLLAELQQQQLVDRLDEDPRRDLGEHLLQLLVVLQRLGVDVLVHPLAERGDLPGLELGLGDDVAVHLHQHLLDDLGAERDGERSEHGDDGDAAGNACS